jgi:hypothetical protein
MTNSEIYDLLFGYYKTEYLLDKMDDLTLTFQQWVLDNLPHQTLDELFQNIREDKQVRLLQQQSPDSFLPGDGLEDSQCHSSVDELMGTRSKPQRKASGTEGVDTGCVESPSLVGLKKPTGGDGTAPQYLTKNSSHPRSV